MTPATGSSKSDAGEDGAADPMPPLQHHDSSLAFAGSSFSKMIAEADREKKPDAFPEGLVQGAARLSDRLGYAADKFYRKPTEGLRQGGVAGLVRGSVEGVVYSSCEIHRGVCELADSSIEGVRGQADILADRVLGTGRSRFKHGSESEGEGCLLQSYRQADEEPRHLFDGVAIGGACLGTSVADGLKGFINKSVKMGQAEGVIGYCKGIGEGTKVLSVKVAAGGLDLASSVVAGAKNTPQAMDRLRKDVMRKSGKDECVEVAPQSLPQPPSVVGMPLGDEDERQAIGHPNAVYASSAECLPTGPSGDWR